MYIKLRLQEYVKIFKIEFQNRLSWNNLQSNSYYLNNKFFFGIKLLFTY